MSMESTIYHLYVEPKSETDELLYKAEMYWQNTDLWLARGHGVEEGWAGSLGLEDANHHI